jgi:tetratricopeptide (TPR) repeat protein
VRAHAFVLLLLFLFVGCSRPAKKHPEVVTTSEPIWVGNLEGQISELERLTKARPEIVQNLQRLSASLYMRGRYTGDPDDIQAGIDRASECIGRDPTNAICFFMRADQEQSLHRFPQSKADLVRAIELGFEPWKTVDLETELAWNDGKYDDAIPAIRKARRDRPSMSTWMREAQLEHELGNEGAADAAFAQAERMIADVSPLPVAHLDVQRGIQKSQSGRMDDAIVFFRAAVKRMPDYVAASEHLAEALHETGKNDEARAIYERIVARSRDPEFLHALSKLHTGDQARAEAEKARARYEELLVKYPEAMYWHASEFFLDIGDKKRALDLLEKNIVLRPNSTSYVALANARLENGDKDHAKLDIDKALAMPLRSYTLFETAAKIYAALGDEKAAADFRARAKKLRAT